jgi:hypothetical protein
MRGAETTGTSAQVYVKNETNVTSERRVYTDEPLCEYAQCKT